MHQTTLYIGPTHCGVPKVVQLFVTTVKCSFKSGCLATALNCIDECRPPKQGKFLRLKLRCCIPRRRILQNGGQLNQEHATHRMFRKAWFTLTLKRRGGNLKLAKPRSTKLSQTTQSPVTSCCFTRSILRIAAPVSLPRRCISRGLL